MSDKDAYQVYVENNYRELIDGFAEYYPDLFAEYCQEQFESAEQAQADFDYDRHKEEEALKRWSK